MPLLVTCGINPPFGGLSPISGQVAHVLLTLAPLTRQCIATPSDPFDLHVLSTPPAFVLSQNQTLHKENLCNGLLRSVTCSEPSTRRLQTHCSLTVCDLVTALYCLSLSRSGNTAHPKSVGLPSIKTRNTLTYNAQFNFCFLTYCPNTEHPALVAQPGCTAMFVCLLSRISLYLFHLYLLVSHSSNDPGNLRAFEGGRCTHECG